MINMLVSVLISLLLVSCQTIEKDETSKTWWLNDSCICNPSREYDCVCKKPIEPIDCICDPELDFYCGCEEQRDE